jgi:NAD(P)-dependent dehydrogenase (short-subunit alcohol dehydrogenase family)
MATRALVVGGTGGIGYAIACRIASDSGSSVVISGRTKPKDIPHSNIEFRQLDASSMHSIKQYTDAYKSAKEQNLDLLVLTQGILTTAGRTETPEGIDRKMALHYYGRQLLIRELTPVLKEDAKVLIVLDGARGNPASLVWEDLDLKTHYTLGNAASHSISMTDGMIQAYAQQNAQNNAKRHFVHAYPGIVNTGLFEGLPWYLRGGTRALGRFIGVSPDTCAENLLKGTLDRAAAGEKENTFWSCIDAKGHLVPKQSWSEEEIKKVEDHTWKIVNDAIATAPQ